MEHLHRYQPICYFEYADSLNAQLQSIKSRMSSHIPHLDRISFALFDEHEQTLRTYADSSLLSLQKAHYEASISRLPALKQCMESGVPRVLNDLTDMTPSPHITMLIECGYRSSAAIPLYQSGDFIGFAFLNSFTKAAFDLSIITRLKPYIDMIQFAVFSEYQLVHAIIECAEQVQRHSPVYHRESQAHKERIAFYARIIAANLADMYGFDDETVENISLFAQFHDLGKTRLPVTLLCKMAPLTSKELIQIRKHIQHGMDIIDEILEALGYPHHPSVLLLSQIMAHHHEFLDGSGYPDGLIGEEIPIAARIVSVANIYDAMTAHKPYRQACSAMHAILELEKMVHQGKLDKHCVEALRESQSILAEHASDFPEFDPKDGFYQ
ncbi:HD domain-containing phosphohydrolase [Vibrio sp. TRT 21S02]|uniref:HD domain-containing phosphohydrolase n=1 Tax=Vibrio sp. TRT 21S02 TaxID=3418507 RepID=UPI003CF9F968